MKIISRQEAKRLGLDRYFTGKPCKHGHVCERYVCSAHCCQCVTLAQRRWKQKNREKWNYIMREFRKNNPTFREKAREYNRRYTEKNRERIRMKSRKDYWNNREIRLEKERQWRREAKIALEIVKQLKSGELNVNEITSELR